MIYLTKLNHEEFVLNSALIETIELIPETKIMLTNGRYYLVLESQQEIIDKIIQFENKKLTLGHIT